LGQLRTMRWPVLAALGAVAITGGVLLAALVGAGPNPRPGGSGGLALNPTGSNVPSAHASAVVPSGAVASNRPASSPRASIAAPPKPTVAAVPARLPLRGDGALIGENVRMAAGPDGGLYVLIRYAAREYLTLLDRRGRQVAGWPQRIPAESCEQLLSAPDGTARLLCDPPPSGDDGLQAPVIRVFFYFPNGQQASDWPIDVEGGAFGARMIGHDIQLVALPYMGDTPIGSTEMVQLVRLGPDGHARVGRSVSYECCDTAFAVGPDGTAVVAAHGDRAEPARTTVTVFDLNGVRPGSPIVIDGDSSEPVFDREGRIYLAVVTDAGSGLGTRRIVLDRDGASLGSSSEIWPIVSTGPSPNLEGPPGPLVVADDGLTFVVEEKPETSILMIDRADTVPDSWPYHSPLGLAHVGTCGPGGTGCSLAVVTPVVDGTDHLFVAHAANSAATGDRIVRLDVAGQVRAGWPVTLKRAGSRFWSMTLAPGGGIWALAIEPEQRDASATILSISDGGNVRWATTIVEP
jgi:hypothetical protein